MPVYDTGYRRFEGTLRGGFSNWWVIAKSEVMLRFSRKLLLFLLIIPSFLPAIGMMIGIYAILQVVTSGEIAEQAGPMAVVAQGFAQGFLDRISNDYYFAFFQIHAFLFLLLWGAFVGSDLISNDRKTNALELYFTRPIRRIDYLLGKFGALAFFLLFTTLLPALLLYLFAVLVAPEGAVGEHESYYQATKHIPMAIVTYSLMQAFVVSTIMLALSSLGRNWILIGAIWGGLYLFSPVVYRIVLEISDEPNSVILSLRDCLLCVGAEIFDVSTVNRDAWKPAAWMLGILTALSLLVLSRRLRVVETVK